MTSTFKKTALLLAVSAAAYPTLASAQGSYNDVVRDNRGNVVRDNRGGCVRTKWLEANDPCGAVAVARPAAPVASAEGNSYLVFFDFDKSNLTAEARDIVAKAASDARAAGATRVNLVGHADRSGTNNYNQRLSERRSASVKRELVRDGIAGGSIVTSARGESDPLVPTEDGVREPQNRRVEISYY